MNIVFGQADLSDIDELIRMRIAYMIDDFGSISDEEREGMEKQLPDYFARKLGTELKELLISKQRCLHAHWMSKKQMF